MFPAIAAEATGFSYDDEAGRYRDQRGRLVGQRRLRAALDVFTDGQADRAQALTQNLRDGRISLSQWQSAMMSDIKTTHLASVAAQRGGWHNMSPADYGRAGQRIRFHYGKLADFAGQIESGKQALDGRALVRAQLYARAGTNTYHLAERADMTRRGFDEERSVLTPGVAHCVGCEAEAAAGWQPLGDMIPIGQRQCSMNDRCTVQYRNSATGEVRR